VVGVAVRAVDHDQRPPDVLVAGVERARAVDQRTRGPRAERDPFRTGRGRRRARRRCGRRTILLGKRREQAGQKERDASHPQTISASKGTGTSRRQPTSKAVDNLRLWPNIPTISAWNCSRALSTC
jgi:hypothetical protein